MEPSVAKTSWANARVKPHSQVHFGSKKLFGPKNLNSQKKFESKKFGVQKMCIKTNFVAKNIFGPKNFQLQKKV